MKTLFSILLIIGITSDVNMKKMILSYPIVISKADLIIEGEISETSFFFSEYEFKVNEFIKGESERKISINMWEEWICDRRIKKPKKGQKLLLFLKENNGEYEIINGSTGELFIKEKDSLETFMRKDFPKLNELKSGIKMFSKSFKYDEKKYFKKLVENSEIEEMKSKNGFYDYLSDIIKIKN
jgi:hypothetical protein